MGKRTTEFVLGFIGGLLGFLSGIHSNVVGLLKTTGGGGLISIGKSLDLANLAIFLSAIAIIGALLVNYKPKIGGWLMIFSAVAGLATPMGLLSFIFLMVAGLMAVIKKSEYEATNESKKLTTVKWNIKLYIIFVLGMIGGIIGVFDIIYELVISMIGILLGGIVILLVLALAKVSFLVLGLVGTFSIKNNTKKRGYFMIIGAFGFLILSFIGKIVLLSPLNLGFYVFAFFVIPGLMAVFMKD